jgi:hypothetical protein
MLLPETEGPSVELFTLVAYEPPADSEAELGFNMVVNVDLLNELGEKTFMVLVGKAIKAMAENFDQVEVDGDVVVVDV